MNKAHIWTVGQLSDKVKDFELIKCLILKQCSFATSLLLLT